MSAIWYTILLAVLAVSYFANQDIINTKYTCHYSTLQCMCQLDLNSTFDRCSVGCAIGNIGHSSCQTNGCPNRFEGLILDSFVLGCG